MSKSMLVSALAGTVAGLAAGTAAAAQELGSVLGERKVASGTGGFTGVLDAGDGLGHALAAIGDLDGDGVGDLVAGVPDDDDGGANSGALWVLFMQPDGSVRGHAKVSRTQGGFPAGLGNVDRFGSAVAALGDIDGDGTLEVAVGAEYDDDGGFNRGAVWIVSLDAAGAVAATRKISQTSGGFTGVLRDSDRFGNALASVGDLDGDGIGELAVGAVGSHAGGTGRGAVWVLFLDAGGRVKTQQEISSTSGGFAGPLRDGDHFGMSLAALGDLDEDGLPDLAVGADLDDDGGSSSGAVWVLFLAADGSVRAQAKLGALAGVPVGAVDRLGASIALVGDVDGDGVPDLAAGALLDDDGGSNAGAVWVLFLARDGALKGTAKISMHWGGFTGPLAPNVNFGSALAALGDLDGDRKLDLAVGALNDDTGGTDRGAFWTLFLETAPLPEPQPQLVVRNGLGINPVVLTAAAPPEIGGRWEVDVDCTGFHRGVVFHLLVDAPADGPVVGKLGQLLIDWRRPHLSRVLAHHKGGPTKLYHRAPRDQALVGFPFYSQAFVTGRGGARLTNALDGVFVAPTRQATGQEKGKK
jgi:hypothetical protein